MSVQALPTRDSQRHSAGSQFHVPMSAFNQDLLKLDKSLAPNGHESSNLGIETSGSRSSKRKSYHIALLIDITPNPDPSNNTSKTQQRPRRSPNETENACNSTYARPTGPKLVSSKHPLLLEPPFNRTYTHDRFIAYLATHIPLDKKGKIPRNEEEMERWKSEDIARLVTEGFPEVRRDHIKVSMIENRLALLDQAENDYFKITYGAYMHEEWGYGI